MEPYERSPPLLPENLEPQNFSYRKTNKRKRLCCCFCLKRHLYLFTRTILRSFYFTLPKKIILFTLFNQNHDYFSRLIFSTCSLFSVWLDDYYYREIFLILFLLPFSNEHRNIRELDIYIKKKKKLRKFKKT